MTNKTIENPIIIFHRAKTNTEKSIANQQAFIESYAKHLPITTIDYVSGDWRKAEEITELVRRNLNELINFNKFIIIIQNSLTEDEFTRQYDRYLYFHFLKVIDQADLYLMDSEGKLYKEVSPSSPFIKLK